MSKAADRLREAGLINPSMIATLAAKNGLPNVYIDYRPAGGTRSAAWQVLRPYQQTDPDGWWGDFGNKTFNVYRFPERAAQLEQAQDWAGEQYGVAEWAQIPGMGTARFPKAVAAFLKDYLRSR